jgi:predicted HTH transcriptional regulator
LYAPYPFKKEKESHIRRIICSFLNANGGILFVGFAKENEKWFAVGSASLKYDMAAIKKSFRQICEAIEPDILTHKMYEIELIPVCKWEKLDTEGFIIKVIVKYGTRDEIYSYK